jgi:predicted metalloprotease
MLEEILNFSLFLMKNFRDKDPETGVAYSKIIKRERYYFDFIWDNTSIQDERVKATTNIDLVNAGIKSRVSAMKDLQINYPEDEQSRVAYEKMNPMLNPELAMQLAVARAGKEPFNPDEEEFKAKTENSKLLRGQQVEVTETNPGQHMIHLRNHKEVMKMARGVAKTNFEKHISEHEQQQNAPAPTAPTGPPTAKQPPGAPMPGMGNEAVRPMAQEGIANPGMPPAM